MDLGWDHKEGLVSFFGVNCYQVCWLHIYRYHLCTSSAASREFWYHKSLTYAYGYYYCTIIIKFSQQCSEKVKHNNYVAIMITKEILNA